MGITSNFQRLRAHIRAQASFLTELMLKLLVEIYRATRDVIVFIVLIYLTAQLSQACLKQALSVQALNLLQNFVEWYAVFYTLALSLIVGQAWRKYNRINSMIDREADALTLIVQTGRLFGDNHLSTQLRVAVESYVNSVRTLRVKDYRTNFTSLHKMRTIRERIGELIKSSQVPDSLKSELIHQFNEAYDARGDRFDLLEQKIPFHIWVVLALFSLAWLWGFFWLDFESPTLSNYVLGCTTFSITYLFSLARDLDDPTYGFWRVKFESFDSRLF